MIKKYNNLSFVFGVPGILLRFLSFVPIVLFTSSRSRDMGIAFLGGIFLFVVGTALLLAGLGYYAKSRGRSWAYCFFAFLGLIGLIVLMCLKDLTLSNQTEGTGGSTSEIETVGC
jgi:hypothetical protein